VFSTGQYYRRAGHDVAFHFDPPLTEDIRTRLNAAGRWANEAAVVFLIATLLDHGVLTDSEPHRRDVESHEHVSIARTLRSIILKEGGRYNPEDAHHRQNMATLTTLYGVPPLEDAFPLDIDTVIVPMIDGCRRYVEACIAAEQRRDA
jgi:hypothetical protein